MQTLLMVCQNSLSVYVLMGLTWLMGVAILQLVKFIIVYGKMRERDREECDK